MPSTRCVGRWIPTVSPLSVVAFSVDDLGALADCLGQAARDELRRGVVRVVASVLRREDRIVRMTEDTFLVALCGRNAGEARAIAERFRDACSTAVHLPNFPDVRVTLSVGIATKAQNDSRDRVLDRADTALACAKILGDNQIVDGERLPQVSPYSLGVRGTPGTVDTQA